jgi:peptide chain release factor 3
LRHVPIITFVNKLDREGRDPFHLLDEIEQSLAIDVTLASWPIGMGRDFLGTYDLFADALLLFERGVHDRVTEPVRCSGLDDAKLQGLLPKAATAKLCEEVEMAKGLCPPFDQEAYREGHLTPVYFGSALNNFGVRELLAGIGELAPAPRRPPLGRSLLRSLPSPVLSSRCRPISTRSTATASPLYGSPWAVSSAA